MDNLNESEMTLEENLDEMQAVMQDLYQNWLEMEVENEKLCTENDKLRAQIVKLNAENDRLNGENEKLNKENNRLNQENQFLHDRAMSRQ